MGRKPIVKYQTTFSQDAFLGNMNFVFATNPTVPKVARRQVVSYEASVAN